MVFVLSVGGGNLEKNVSVNLVLALQYAKQTGAQAVGVVRRDGGYTAQVADACVIVPTVNPQNVTPQTEVFQAVVWHLLVSHPTLKGEEIESLHATLRMCLPLDDFRLCFHDTADQCACRKPKPGLLLDAARDWNLALPASYMIGDRWRDVGAGQRAGCVALFVDRHYAERQPDPPLVRVRSLNEAAEWILAQGASTI